MFRQKSCNIPRTVPSNQWEHRGRRFSWNLRSKRSSGLKFSMDLIRTQTCSRSSKKVFVTSFRFLQHLETFETVKDKKNRMNLTKELKQPVKIPRFILNLNTSLQRAGPRTNTTHLVPPTPSSTGSEVCFTTTKPGSLKVLRPPDRSRTLRSPLWVNLHRAAGKTN